MISEAIINLGIVGITFLVLLLYLIRFVLRYKHEYESNPLCTSTVLFCLLVVLTATFVLPVDVFLVSFVKEPDGSLKQWATNETLASIDNAVFAAYYCKFKIHKPSKSEIFSCNKQLTLTLSTYTALYGITTFLVFVVIPFLHFLNEETESSASDRLYNAIKYTFAFIILMTLLLVFGALMKNGSADPNTIFNKIIHLAETTKVQDALNMVLTILTIGGFLNITFYTASGIFSWPIGLFLGTSSVANRFSAVNDRELILRMRINTLQEKSRVGQLTTREREQLIEAENDLRDVEREEIALSGYSGSLTYKLRKCIRPLQILVGSIFGILSIVLVVTLVMVNIDRILHGAGPKQGYILLKPLIFNPLDYVYTKAQNLLFIGPLPLLMVTCFLVVGTISGIRNLGLWLLFARLHRIKVGRTQPQALLFFCITIMLAALSFNLILYSMTTQYVTFGSQNFHRQGPNGTSTVEPCTLDNYHPDCILTRSSILLMRMMSQIWIFGAVFYWMSWAFVVVASISLIAFLVRGKREATHGLVSDDNEFED